MTRVRYVGGADATVRLTKAEEKADQRAPISRLVKTLIAITLGGLGFIVLLRCELSEIRVQGASLVDLDGVRSLLEPQLGNSLLLVETDALRELLLQDPWVEDVRIHRRLPGEMRVVVHAAQPCMRLVDGRSVSTRGELLPAREDIDFSPLPLLDVEAEELLALEARGVLAEFCSALSGVPWPFSDPLIGVEVANGQWDLRDSANIRYCIGQDQFPLRLQRLAIARDRFVARGGDCVDLRFDRQIVLIPAVAGSYGG